MKVGVDDDKRDNNTLFATNRKDMLIVNVGEVPIKVFNYRLGNKCNNNGFLLLNCKDDATQDAFVLNPYDFHAFEIEYRSDCAASYSTAHLNVEAALGMKIRRKNHFLTLPIRASVAWAILPACAEAYVLSAYGEPQAIVKCALLMIMAYILLQIRKGVNRFNKTSMPLVDIPKISPVKLQTERVTERVEMEEQEDAGSADPKSNGSIDTNETNSDEKERQNTAARGQTGDSVTPLRKMNEVSPQIDVAQVTPPVTEISPAKCEDRTKDKSSVEVKVDKSKQKTSTKVKLSSKNTPVRSTPQKEITERREKARGDKETALSKTLSTNSEKKAGSFFANKRKDLGKSNRGMSKREERREIKSVETKVVENDRSQRESRNAMENSKAVSTIRKHRSQAEKRKQDGRTRAFSGSTASKTVDEDQKLKDEVKKLREEAALLRKKNEEAEEELRKRRAEENRKKAAENAKREKEKSEQKRQKIRRDKTEARNQSTPMRNSKVAEKTNSANSNLGPEDEELLKPSRLTRGKTVRRPPPGFMSGQDSMLVDNANINGTNKSLNLYGEIGKSNYAFMGHNVNAGNDVNNLNDSNSFANGSNTVSNSLNFMNFDRDQRSRSRSGSGNNSTISGHPSPGMLPPANTNTNHLNFKDVDKLAPLSSITAAQDRNVDDNSGNRNGSYGFSGNSLFDSSVSGSNAAFGESFNGHLGGSSYIQSNNSTFSLDLPNVSSVIPMKGVFQITFA